MDGHSFEIVLLNDVDAAVVYYNRVEASLIPESSPRIAAQCFVWRDRVPGSGVTHQGLGH